LTACAQPRGYIDNHLDCHDGERLAWTGAMEICDGVDNDCDGLADGEDVVQPKTWHADGDGDGFTDPAITAIGCEPPGGFASPSKKPDCDDGDASVNPAAREIRRDGIDQDCDGVDYTDRRKRRRRGCATSGPGDGDEWLVLLALLVARRRETSC
jgi:hypothetical protein